jgi:hypothetical protein
MPLNPGSTISTSRGSAANGGKPGRPQTTSSEEGLSVWNTNGGIGPVARRGWDDRTAAYLDEARGRPNGIALWMEGAPLRLLRVLVALHPLAQMAMSADLALAFGGKSRIVAVKDYRGGKGQVDDGATALLDELWKRYDPTALSRPNRTAGRPSAASLAPDLAAGVSGLKHLRDTIGEQTNTAGMYCLEAVPGAPGEGVRTILDFDPLSTRFNDKDDGSRILEHFRRAKDGKDSGWFPLDTSTVLAMPWRGSRSNPYGQARYAAFLGEGLADIREKQALRDWLRAAAWPRVAYEIPVESIIAYAKDNPDVLVRKDGTSMTTMEYVRMEMGAFIEQLENLASDDSVYMPEGANANVLNAAGVGGLAEVLKLRRMDKIQALDQLPNLMGVTDGGTQAYATAQLMAQAFKLTGFRDHHDAGLVAIGNLHLRLLGIDMICRQDADPINLNDLLNYWKAERERNAVLFERMEKGMTTPEETAVALVGHGMMDPTRAYASTTPAPAAADTAPASGTGTP